MPDSFPPVLVLFNLPREAKRDEGIAESDAGVLAEVEAVSGALKRMGRRFRTQGIGDLADLRSVLGAAPESVVFNLVEDLRGPPEDAACVPALCRAWGKEATGCDTPALLLTLDKWRSKAVLRAAGLPAPEGVTVAPGERFPHARFPGPYLVKPLARDASEGIEEDSVTAGTGPELDALVRRIHERFRQPALVEQYVGDREFNVSVLDIGGEPKVLPIAEIEFVGFAAGRPRIVDYAAKWRPDSFQYTHTPRVLPARIPEALADRIRNACLEAWQALGCRDYVRVDLRMGSAGGLYVLEVNPNPDLSPDAGFAAALSAGGIPFDAFVGSMLRNAAERLPAEAARATAGEPEAAVQGTLSIRHTLAADREAILHFVESTGYFRPDEVDIAREVLDEALAKGPRGHYQSFTAEWDGEPVGWVCFGPTPCTVGTYDVYWIAVNTQRQRRGLGRRLLRLAEEKISERGGRLVVIETSGHHRYASTRGFYLRAGYREGARIPEFYASGDDKLVYIKRLG